NPFSKASADAFPVAIDPKPGHPEIGPTITAPIADRDATRQPRVASVAPRGGRVACRSPIDGTPTRRTGGHAQIDMATVVQTGRKEVLWTQVAGQDGTRRERSITHAEKDGDGVHTPRRDRGIQMTVLVEVREHR